MYWAHHQGTTAVAGKEPTLTGQATRNDDGIRTRLGLWRVEADLNQKYFASCTAIY